MDAPRGSTFVVQAQEDLMVDTVEDHQRDRSQVVILRGCSWSLESGGVCLGYASH